MGSAALRATAALLFLACAPATPPNSILHNGIVFTGDVAAPPATAVAITGDRITAVGSDAELLVLADEATAVINLGGRATRPGSWPRDP